MMTTSRRLLLVALLALPAAGCKQKQGDRCQLTSDCDDGLICLIKSTDNLATGGTCQPPGTVIPDASVPVDFAGIDGATASADGGTDDGAAPDLGVAEDATVAPDLTAAPDLAEVPDLASATD